MATILNTPNGKFKAVIRNAQGRYICSKTFTRKTDARIWSRRIEADREAMEALGDRLLVDISADDIRQALEDFGKAKPYAGTASRPGAKISSQAPGANENRLPSTECVPHCPAFFATPWMRAWSDAIPSRTCAGGRRIISESATFLTLSEALYWASADPHTGIGSIYWF